MFRLVDYYNSARLNQLVEWLSPHWTVDILLNIYETTILNRQWLYLSRILIKSQQKPMAIPMQSLNFPSKSHHHRLQLDFFPWAPAAGCPEDPARRVQLAGRVLSSVVAEIWRFFSVIWPDLLAWKIWCLNMFKLPWARRFDHWKWWFFTMKNDDLTMKRGQIDHENMLLRQYKWLRTWI